MNLYLAKFFKPFPKEERAVLYEEKLRHYRPFAAMVMWLGALLTMLLWSWDFAIDPIGAPDVLPLRMQVAAIFTAFGFYLHFNIWPKYRGVFLIVTMVGTQAHLYPILDLMETGHMVGMGAFLFWYIFLPLLGVGMTLKETLAGMLSLAVAPLVWFALGLTPDLLVDVFVMYMWPAGGVVAIILVANNQFMLQMIRDQRLLKEAKELAEAQARTDALTELNNRRAFFEKGNAAFLQAKRYGHPLSVVLFDLDHFKRINDTYGHTVGDRVIVAMAGIIHETARESDISGRIGGEEFALVLVEVGAEKAMHMTARLQSAIAGVCVETEEAAVTFTASMGVAELDAACPDLDTLIAHADRALYDAKHAGRNCVVVWDG